MGITIKENKSVSKQKWNHASYDLYDFGGHTLCEVRYLYNICVLGNVSSRLNPLPTPIPHSHQEKKKPQKIKSYTIQDPLTKKAGKMWKRGLGLAQIWRGVTRPNVLQ